MIMKHRRSPKSVCVKEYIGSYLNEIVCGLYVELAWDFGRFLPSLADIRELVGNGKNSVWNLGELKKIST